MIQHFKQSIMSYISNKSFLITYFKYHNNCFSMSILSNSNYDQTVHAIRRLKQVMQEESAQEMQKYEIISIKTKIIEEQILEAKLATDKHQVDCQRKIQQFSVQTKTKLKEIRLSASEKEVDNDLSKELKQLENCRDRLIKTIKGQAELTSEKLENQINVIQQNFNYKVKVQRESFVQTEKALKEQINNLRKKILQNDYDSQAQQMISTLQEMKGNIERQTGELRSKRKQKKDKFLQLLEAIIIKCKQKNS